eukprot:68219-Prymnesium_polylepis.1
MGNAPSGTAALGQVTWRLDSFALAGGRACASRGNSGGSGCLRSPTPAMAEGLAGRSATGASLSCSAGYKRLRNRTGHCGPRVQAR